MKSSRTEMSILFAAIFFAHLCEFYDLPIMGGSKTIFLCLLLISLVTRSWKTVACTLILTLISFDRLIIPSYLQEVPILGFMLAFLIAAAILFVLPQTRQSLWWMRKGSIDRTSWALVILTSLVSALALILWAYWTDNLGFGKEIVKSFGAASSWLIYAVYIPLFALFNALAEEVVYRGLIQESLMQVFSNVVLIVLLQASAFAAVHFKAGFPNGIVGYLMVLVYGSMLGYLRIRTKGILAPYIAHVVADATIAMLLVHLVR